MLPVHFGRVSGLVGFELLPFLSSVSSARVSPLPFFRRMRLLGIKGTWRNDEKGKESGNSTEWCVRCLSRTSLCCTLPNRRPSPHVKQPMERVIRWVWRSLAYGSPANSFRSSHSVLRIALQFRAFCIRTRTARMCTLPHPFSGAYPPFLYAERESPSAEDRHYIELSKLKNLD